MRTLTRSVFLFALTGLSLTSNALRGAETRTFYYAIELNGVLCGYSEIAESLTDKNLIRLDQKVHARLTALGMPFNSEVRLTYEIDPETGGWVYHDSDLRQGPTHLSSRVTVQGRTAHFAYDASSRDVEFPAEAIFENTLFHPHLKRDFAQGGADRKTYSVLDVRDAEIQQKAYSRVGTETLNLAGGTHQALVLEEVNQKTGMRTKIWLEPSSGRLLRVEMPGQRTSYLADASVVKRIQVASLDGVLLKKANVSIADFQSISHMKVRASLQPSGVWLTAEKLQAPGQSFTGTVEENRIEGVFEVQHPRYQGAGAPPFPPDFGRDESLRPYLETSEFIEAEDPVLAGKAREITDGSRDSWQAVNRLSRWVSQNIAYSIPGGGTARKTYETRAGECGSHSFLLASFCRAVGIPARVIWGCMYTPNQGGAFGQHAWNEVYMGKAGWIPLDSTASEVDFVDSGHIRIGEYASVTTALNANSFEILDYGLISSGARQPAAAVSAKYDALVGKYVSTAGNQSASVAVQNAAVVLDLHGKAILAFKDPDEAGRWTSKMSDRLYCTFTRNPSGQAEEIVLHQLLPMRRTSADEPPAETPSDLKPYLGKYLLPQLQAEFTVLFQDGNLAVNDPVAKRVVRFKPSGTERRWVDEFDKSCIYFECDDKGAVTGMVIDSITRFARQPVADPDRASK